jgi:hypothetical protein
MSEYIDDNVLDPNEYEYEYVYFNDGKLIIYNSDDDDEAPLPPDTAEDWIDKHEEILHYLYEGLCEYELGNKATFPDFCEFMLYVSVYHNTDIADWVTHADTYAFKFKHNRNPTLKEFAAHHLHEIIDMYRFLDENTSLNIGPVINFIEYLYIYSDRVLK